MQFVCDVARLAYQTSAQSKQIARKLRRATKTPTQFAGALPTLAHRIDALCLCARQQCESARRTMRSHCLPWIHSLAGSAPFASERARARATCCWLISSSISAARICHSLTGRSQATLSLDCATNSLIQNDSDKLQDRKTKAAPIQSQHATSNNNHRRRGHTCQVRKQIMRRRRLRSTH